MLSRFMPPKEVALAFECEAIEDDFGLCVMPCTQQSWAFNLDFNRVQSSWSLVEIWIYKYEFMVGPQYHEYITFSNYSKSELSAL